jgi:hypothetical protein
MSEATEHALDFSVRRTVTGASGAVFTCRKFINAVAADFRELDGQADVQNELHADAQARLEDKLEGARDDEARSKIREEIEKLETQIQLSRFAAVATLLLDDTGRPPRAETLIAEFAAAERPAIITHVVRPTLPDWLERQMRDARTT